MRHILNILQLFQPLRPVFFLAAFLAFALETYGQDKSVDDVLSALTLRQRIGQLFIFGFPDTVPGETLHRLIREETPGALIVFGRNVRSLEQIAALNHQAQNWARSINGVPLLLMVDQEGGSVARLKIGTPLPSALALGETGNLRLIERYGQAMGRLMSGVGFNVNLAPVLDLSDPQQLSFIGPRSFGIQPVQVGRAANAFARGLSSAGVIPTAKHFPGHGGIATDSHQLTPRKLETLQELSAGELIPFSYFARAKYPRAVMMAHVSFPQIDPSGIPSAFSSVFIGEVLRRRMKFDGLIITDDVEMAGASSAGSIDERVVRAIEAGNDMVMVASSLNRQRRAIRAIEAAVLSGRISRERIDASVRRILDYKNSVQSAAGPAAHLAVLKQNLLVLAEQVKRFNFTRSALSNAELRGLLARRAPVTVYSSDAEFYRTFRQRYLGRVHYVSLRRDVSGNLESLLLNDPGPAVYYASGEKTARRLNQLTASVKKKLVVVNANQPGALENRGGFRAVFQLNTMAPESGRWLADFLTAAPLRSSRYQVGSN